MVDFCEINRIFTVNQFMDYARKYRKDWWTIYCEKAGVRNLIADYCKNQGYENRFFHNYKPRYWKIPIYDEDGVVMRDKDGVILSDKQII